ncbi:peptidase [Pseudoxanthomonas kalamensis DSM 18571]|uniref:peptidoglycan DD-metalloendopeptidase family protein n=1 Tax=Pseudoxanthomonas kalamensis TaxID=289483 RepID=UPI001391E852|nr:M23 family metallopeptidase [Pseudoxanthomonas kalamensis]KAF1711274.1 peptidase [Pseudoxanthomonas kalamensis DSM 18571]
MPGSTLPRPLRRVTLLAWLIGLAAFATTADAARLYKWKDLQGVTRYGDQPPDNAQPVTGKVEVLRYRNPGAPLVRLRLEKQPTRYLAWADNDMHGPVQVQLEFRRNRNMLASPALPVAATVAGGDSTQLAALLITDGSGKGDFELDMRSVPGDPRAHPRDHLYRLPFQADMVRVDQGPGGRFSHDDAQNLYAVDFAIPEGTPVLAARAGVVMQVEGDFDRAGPDREAYGGRANFIRILHDDGSMAVYAHLQPEGVQVREGQSVHEGQRIGLSGNTGFSTAPHLHFVVQVNRGMRLESIPVRIQGPLGELKFPAIH